MPTQIVFLLSPQMHLLDLAGPDQVFLEAIEYGANLSIQYCTFTHDISTSAGLPIRDVIHFSNLELKSGDFLILPGANMSYLHSEEMAAQHKLFEWIRNLYSQKVNLCSVCTGAFILAQSGVLNGKSCTTHFKRTTELQRYYPAIKVIENVLFTVEDNIYTSAGIASGIDMALYLLEQIKGDYFTHKVARELVIYNRRNSNEAQESIYLKYRNHIHAGIHNVQDWLIHNLNKIYSLDSLASIATMSTRNFTRVFKKETSITVNQYITLLRKQKINELSKNVDLSRLQIAQACGLSSERQLSRIMQMS